MIKECVLIPVCKMKIKVKEWEIVVDDCDENLVGDHSWFMNGKHLYTHIGDTTKSLSHLILADADGCIRHINGDYMDFRRTNLIITTMSDCCQNRLQQSNNKSGTTGVSYSKTKNRWIASVQKDGKRMQKSFHTKEMAIIWRESFEIPIANEEHTP